MDRFHRATAPRHRLLHGYGNVFQKVRGPGDQIDVEPGGWVYRDPTVKMSPQVFGLANGHLRRVRSYDLQPRHRPGRVGIQTMYLRLPTSE